MRIIGLAALTLCFLASACATVDTKVVIEENSEPDSETAQRLEAQNTSMTLEEKLYLESQDSSDAKEIIFNDVKPIVTYPPEWRVSDLGNKVIFELPDDGKLTLEYQRNITDDGIDWLITNLSQLQDYGFVYRTMAQINPRGFKIIGDNLEARKMFAELEDYPFNPDVITVAGFLGNKDCIWKLYGFFNDPIHTTNIYNTFKEARLAKWEEQ